MSSAHWRRYALWQARDYLIDRGLATVLITVLFAYLTAAPLLLGIERTMQNMPARVIARYGSIEAARAAQLHDVNAMFLRSFLGVVVFLGAMMAMNGIAANDRKQGYYRFLFSKAVSPLRFYGQAFLVGWAGFVAIVTALSLVYGALVAPILTPQLILAVAVMFLLYAGIMFMLSASFPSDWLLLVLFTVLASYLWDRWGTSPSIFHYLLYVLPPLSRTADIYSAVGTGAPLDAWLLGWFGAYGAACAVAALIVLRYRRLAIL